MTIQEQAFITYYASMTDAELLQVASNKTSLIEVAQKTLDNELVKRNLVTAVAVPVDVPVQIEPLAFNVFRKLVRMFERVPRH
jgi:hypothetical protein